MRKIIVELLLANHSESCPTCQKSTTCQLQALARRLGITKVRFKKQDQDVPLDYSSPSLVRDPNKCVLCGDCVRICSEIQSVGAIDFAYRGAQTDGDPFLRKGPGQGGVCQLRPVRPHLPDRGPHAEIGGGRGLEGASRSRKGGRCPGRPGGPGGPRRDVRPGSRA